MVEAADLNSLFAEAGQALFSLIVSNLDDVQLRTRTDFTVQGSELEYLLVDWLTELLFTFESQRLLLREFDVSIDANGLKATAVGETIDESRHQLDHEIKAITYHGLRVEQAKGNWIATVIVDI
jgi:SHS2 domain-containing protein